MKVTAIILRYKYSKGQVIHNAEHLQVDDYIIIDNSKHNVGTAAGFTEGMKQVKDGFIWLLDEDNIPWPDALAELEIFWDWVSGVKSKTCLASYRKDTYDKLVDINSIIGTPNACYGLNIFDYKQTCQNFKRERGRNRIVPVAMYGGMFFHSDLLKVIGYPNEKYFIYSDDYEWSYRITKAGGEILIVEDSIINEPPHRTEDEYYRVRNAIWFSKQFITNKFKFYINCLVYKIYLRLAGRQERFRAVKDGMK